MQRSRKQQSYKPLYGIIATFLIPIVVAHGLFYFGYGKNQASSKGTLLSPPIKIQNEKKSFWQIARIDTNKDPKQQLTTLYKRWQALGRDKKRVHLTVLTTAIPSQKNTDIWQFEQITPQSMSSLQVAKSKTSNACSIFIIDPENRAILCYDQTNEPRDIDLDLRKLLKSSRT